MKTITLLLMALSFSTDVWGWATERDSTVVPRVSDRDSSFRSKVSVNIPQSDRCNMSTQKCVYSTSPVRVDLQRRCMCVQGHPCFKIAIGSRGPMMTHNGTTTIEPINGLIPRRGGKYQTLPGNGSSSYDSDGLSIGPAANSSVGKWIHKTRNCGHQYTTAGCVGVPCKYWPLVKSTTGQNITVCGGAGPNVVQPKTLSPNLKAKIDRYIPSADPWKTLRGSERGVR